ncbi:transposase [Actinobacillus ureae]|nr:transposase [Actinobacillus ureae]SUU46057.1 transposase [Actinobacillus ureae]
MTKYNQQLKQQVIEFYLQNDKNRLEQLYHFGKYHNNAISERHGHNNPT